MADRDLPVVGTSGMMRSSVRHHVAAAALALGLLAIDDMRSAASQDNMVPDAPRPKAPENSDIAAQMRADRARRKAEAFQKRQQK